MVLSSFYWHKPSFVEDVLSHKLFQQIIPSNSCQPVWCQAKYNINQTSSMTLIADFVHKRSTWRGHNNVLKDIHHGFCNQVTMMTLHWRFTRHSSRNLLPRYSDEFTMTMPTRLLWHSSRFIVIQKWHWRQSVIERTSFHHGFQLTRFDTNVTMSFPCIDRDVLCNFY